jgi:DNA topoisomerase-3
VGDNHFKSSGKVLVEPGWQAIYGKEVDEEEDKESGKVLVKVNAGETPKAETAEPKGLKTKPPARYTEATLLTAMQTAGKNVEDDDQREAMQDKGLGTPATRAAIIEGLLNEKYILREIRELVPTAKAFQLFTLLRGLGVEELSKPELTGGWEHKLALMEHGGLSREAFMREIAEMTEHIVKKAKEFDRDTIPGDYTTLKIACPTCGGVVRENYRRYGCIGKDALAGDGATGCGFSISKIPGGRTFEAAEVEQLIENKQIGPLEGFRSKAGWPFTAEIALKFSEEEKNWKLEFDFGEDKNADSGEIVEFANATSLGNCPKCSSPVYDHGSNYVCSKTVPTHAQPTPSCDFKSGKIILQQSVAPEQMTKLLAEGKTELLDKFVSMRTRRPFKAFLQWDAEAGKVNFAFEPRVSKYPARAGKTPTTNALIKAAGKKVPAKSTKAAKAKAEKMAKPKAPRKVTAGFLPSNELAAVIGAEAVARTEVIKRIWDYIKANGLQDATNKRAINADAKLKPVFGKDQVTMFELAGIAVKHLRPVGE